MESLLDRITRDMTTGCQQVLVLGTIAKHEPIHGYAIIRALDETTGHAYWKEGTIYPLLAKLERDGVLVAEWGTPESGARRKYYRMTPAGTSTLKAAKMRWGKLRQTLDHTLDQPLESPL